MTPSSRRKLNRKIREYENAVRKWTLACQNEQALFTERLRAIREHSRAAEASVAAFDEKEAAARALAGMLEQVKEGK